MAQNGSHKVSELQPIPPELFRGSGMGMILVYMGRAAVSSILFLIDYMRLLEC
jgi:hypothetical protein